MVVQIYSKWILGLVVILGLFSLSFIARIWFLLIVLIYIFVIKISYSYLFQLLSLLVLYRFIQDNIT